jgi:hypothetical protein
MLPTAYILHPILKASQIAINQLENTSKGFGTLMVSIVAK